MTQATMYPAKAGSKRTTITADIDAAATQVQVADLSVFPVAPNLSTLQSDANVWETCLYTEKSAESGPGYLTITRSGEGHDSSSGGALSWSSGAMISRNPCGLDHDRFKANIEEIAGRLSPVESTLSSHVGSTSNPHGVTPAQIGSPTSTTASTTIYVDSAATGVGDGVDWTNAFTTIQAAINSLPAIINHDVTIYIRKGATEYDESITVRRIVGAGSITIRAEYFWYGTNTSSKTGKIDLGSSDFGYADRANIEAGDKVLVVKWAGTVNASAPTASYEDTVASVSGTEITLTTNTGIAFNTLCTYLITKPMLRSTTGTQITVTDTNAVYLWGLYSSGCAGRCIRLVNSRGVDIRGCSCASIGSGSSGIQLESKSSAYASMGIMKGNTGYGIYAVSQSDITWESYRVELTASSGNAIGGSCAYLSSMVARYNHIADALIGLNAISNSYIYAGAHILNEATTPKSPASSTDNPVIA